MQAPVVTNEQVRDVTEYLKTLKPAPPMELSPDAEAQSAIERGRVGFNRRGCNSCHVPPTYTASRTFDVGLEDELKSRRFNPPSLRGVGQRTALFHDGRSSSLEAAMLIHPLPLKDEVPESKVSDLLAFIRSL